MSNRPVGRPSGSTLTRADFVVAAFAITAHEGLDRVSHSTLARRLQVSRATAYHHVGSIDTVLDEVGEQVVAGIALPDDRDWRDWCENMVHRVRDRLLAYHGVARRIRTIGPRSPSQLALIEQSTAVLMSAGMSARDAALTYATLLNITCDSVEFVELRRREHSTGAPARQDWDDLYSGGALSPTLRQILPIFVQATNDELFTAAVRAVLDGTEHLATR